MEDATAGQIMGSYKTLSRGEGGRFKTVEVTVATPQNPHPVPHHSPVDVDLSSRKRRKVTSPLSENIEELSLQKDELEGPYSEANRVADRAEPTAP